MNKLFFKCVLVLIVFCASLTLISCEDDSKNWSEIVFFIVSSEKGEYYPFGSSNACEGLKIKKEGESSWTIIPLTGIEGFNYEEGFNYCLKVEIIHLVNPPKDESNVKYKLVEIISKKSSIN